MWNLKMRRDFHIIRAYSYSLFGCDFLLMSSEHVISLWLSLKMLFDLRTILCLWRINIKFNDCTTDWVFVTVGEILLHYTLSDMAHWQQLGSKSKRQMCLSHSLWKNDPLLIPVNILPNSHFQRFFSSNAVKASRLWKISFHVKTLGAKQL